MRPKIRSDHPEECLCSCVCVGDTASDQKMAEGQGDIEAITLMKTNEGQSKKEREEGKREEID